MHNNKNNHDENGVVSLRNKNWSNDIYTSSQVLDMFRLPQSTPKDDTSSIQELFKKKTLKRKYSLFHHRCSCSFSYSTFNRPFFFKKLCPFFLKKYD